MKFEDMSLGTQVGISLERYANFHDLPLRECGVGSFQMKSGRDAHRAWCLTTKWGVMYYVYLQVAYTKDQTTGLKISKVSSIVLFDFSSGTEMAKAHLNSVSDIKKFYDAIESIVLK